MNWLREKIIKMIGYLSLRGHEVPEAISLLEIAVSLQPAASAAKQALRNDVVKKKGVPFQDVPINIKYFVPIITILAFAQLCWAGMGLEINPGEIYVKDVALGKKVAVSALGGERMKLQVENKGDSKYTYIINILSSSKVGAPLTKGYTDIPDIAWIWPENKEVEIAGHSVKTVELYIKIPQRKEYYNKQYQAVIEVKTKKNNPNDQFVLACLMKIHFSTLNLDVKEAKNENK